MATGPGVCIEYGGLTRFHGGSNMIDNPFNISSILPLKLVIDHEKAITNVSEYKDDIDDIKEESTSKITMDELKQNISKVSNLVSKMSKSSEDTETKDNSDDKKLSYSLDQSYIDSFQFLINQKQLIGHLQTTEVCFLLTIQRAS